MEKNYKFSTLFACYFEFIYFVIACQLDLVWIVIKSIFIQKLCRLFLEGKKQKIVIVKAIFIGSVAKKQKYAKPFIILNSMHNLCSHIFVNFWWHQEISVSFKRWLWKYENRKMYVRNSHSSDEYPNPVPIDPNSKSGGSSFKHQIRCNNTHCHDSMTFSELLRMWHVTIQIWTEYFSSSPLSHQPPRPKPNLLYYLLLSFAQNVWP